MVPFIVLCILGGLTAAAWQYRRSDQNRFDRVLRALIPLVAALASVVLLVQFAYSSSQDWNEAKLAPVLGMTRGYALYQDPASGVMTGWIYGPVGALVLLPSALGRDPTTVVLIGMVISAVCYLLPVGWLLWVASQGQARTLTIITFLIVFLASLRSEDLARCLFLAAPDSVALGLGTCAGIGIYRDRSPRNLILSALAAVLCVWTKQNYLPLPAALLCWVVVIDGWKVAGRFLAVLMGAFALISPILIFSFGASAMWFHMVELPGHQPWRDPNYSGMMLWFLGTHDLISISSMSLGLLGTSLALSAILLPQASSIREWLAIRPWMLFAVVGIFLIPGGLIGYLKAGGYFNSLACTNFFLFVAGVAGLVELSRKMEFNAPLRQFIEAGALCFALVMGTAAILNNHSGLRAVWPLVVHPYHNARQTAFHYAQSHQEEIYCPWNPLTTLLADGKLYHFEWGIVDRMQYASRPSTEQFRGHFPVKLNKVVYANSPQSMAALEVLFRFRNRAQITGLEGCDVYTR